MGKSVKQLIAEAKANRLAYARQERATAIKAQRIVSNMSTVLTPKPPPKPPRTWERQQRLEANAMKRAVERPEERAKRQLRQIGGRLKPTPATIETISTEEKEDVWLTEPGVRRVNQAPLQAEDIPWLKENSDD